MSTDTAEEIGEAIREFRRRRVNIVGIEPNWRMEVDEIADAANCPIVDVSPIHRSWTDPFLIYEDSTVRPPWEEAALCYVNQHGQVLVMHYTAVERPATDTAVRWETAEPIDWETVRWVSATSMWMSGINSTGIRTTVGPLHQILMAVNTDGQLLDLHWIQLDQKLPLEAWNNAQGVLLRTLTLLNCRNVEILEPRRPRPQSRRIARTGTVVTEVHVTPVGNWRRRPDAKPRPFGEGAPMGVVRGHIARYGPEHGRGLLFGRHAGIFWIPAHIRGSREIGVVERTYEITK